ncbi:hypothetical protein [Acinetobacter gerneri]|uniref:hypothetical protein n=1 Tax=Acinetobacter gerneri TaxID=202952 RepID=UPI00321221DC
MVIKHFLLTAGACVLMGCSGTDNPTNSHEPISTIPETEKIAMTKDEYDKEYFESIRDWISENDFLRISDYVIKKTKENNFQDNDPILGKKEIMYSKDFSDPYISYHYINIPNLPHTEVYLKYKKNNNKLSYISLSPGGPISFILNNSNINILEALKLKLVKKEQFSYSNELAEYQLSDGILKYQVVAKNNQANDDLPKEFYSFDIYIE